MLKDSDLLCQVEPIIKEVGKLQRSYFARAQSLKRYKKDGAGIVTEADLESEKILIEKLSPIIPGAAFFAEESGPSGDNAYCWVIDPLDGTTNFAHGIPHFCISVALTYEGQSIMGAVYQPILDEFFWAERGKGAWLNGEKIAVSLPKGLNESLLVVGLPYIKDGDYSDVLKRLILVKPKIFGFRYFGAAALDLASVACGRFDGIFFTNLSWWDYAAGDLLIQEAGGQTSDFEGLLIGRTSKSFLGGGPKLHKGLLELMRSIEPG